MREAAPRGNARVLDFVKSGGAGGTRTPYLILAKDALSLMSYSPTKLVEDEGLDLNRGEGWQACRAPLLYGGRMAKRRGRVASTPTLTAGQ